MIYKELVKEMNNEDSIKNIYKTNEYCKTISALFDKYFENKENLEKYCCDHLVQDFINYQKCGFQDIDDCIMEIIEVFHLAKTKKSKLMFSTVSLFQPITVEMGNKYWSMCKMQNDFSELEPYEYVTECFSLIENVCEILLKEYFALLVCIIRIANNKSFDYYVIRNNKFGNLFNELKQSNMITKMLNILDSDIPVSQWRNIACHKSYKYNEGQISCRFGQNLEKEIIVESKEKLLEITKSIYRISQVITFASKMFLYDNIYEIRSEMDSFGIDIINSREEDWQLIYVTELYANGFNVLDITDEDKMIITIQDITDGKKENRVVIVPLAIYKAWVLTSKKRIKIVYVTKEGDEYLSAELSSDSCEMVSSGEKDFSYLAEMMTVEKF